MPGTRRCPEPNFVINDEYHIGWSSELNRKMHVKCLVENLTLLTAKQMLPFICITDLGGNLSKLFCFLFFTFLLVVEI